MNNDKKMQLFLEHYGGELFTDYNSQDDASYEIYRETTSDGYEVFIAKHTDEKTLYVSEHIHYYTHDLEELCVEWLIEGEAVYLDEDLFEDLYMEDRLADEYDKLELDNDEDED